MPAAPATITCGSCGMQYDGTGMKAGVQFQCTQCQAMVVVGAPAGGKKPMGKATRGPGGPARAAGRPGMRGPAAGGAPEQQPYAAPVPAKNNSVMMFGIIGGVIVVGLIATVIIMTTNKGSQQRAAQEAEAQREKDEKAAQERKNAEVKNDSAARTKTIDAGTQAGNTIASALANKDLTGLAAMFDWDVVQKDFCQQLEKQSKDAPTKDGQPELDKAGKPKISNYQKFLNDPIFCDGEWEKRDDGRYSGVYIGKMPRGSDSLKARLMWYIENSYAGAGASMDTAAMEKASAKGNDKFSMTIDGKLYLGRVCMIKSAAAPKLLQFFVGGMQGEVNVKILRFDDPQRAETVKQLEAKFQRKDEGKQDGGDFSNPDRDPNKDPKTEPGTEPEGPEAPQLAEAQKTGAQCPQDLTNIFRDIRDGKELTTPQLKTLQDQSRSKKDRKAFIGALVDLLIDNFKEKKRTECEAITGALFKVWGNSCGYGEKDATYDRQTFDENTTDFAVRVWYDFYNRYKAE